MQRKSSKKRSTKVKTKAKVSLEEEYPHNNADSNGDLLISMNELSSHSSDNSNDVIPVNGNDKDFDIDPIDIDNTNDNDVLNFDVDDSGFGFDDFMNSAMETPWRHTPNPNNENNGISKKKQLSKKDNKGKL